MPLHLLGKKSWNVYNHDNIDRVRRDEAEAQAREEEQDRRNQIVDAERRLKILRGEQVEALPTEAGALLTPDRRDRHGQSRKRRRVAGEDDTDRDMRLAREEAALQPSTSGTAQATNEPLTDARGHINLFPANSQPKEKNAEAEAERAKKKREFEDQYTMRFSNAAGFKQNLDAPWYSCTSNKEVEISGKDVWGNDDTGRRQREKMRTDANDPLAMMKRGVKQLRDVEKSRNDWIAEREGELRELEALELSRDSKKRHGKRRRRRHDSDELEGFSLNEVSDGNQKRDQHRRHRPHISRGGGRREKRRPGQQVDIR